MTNIIDKIKKLIRLGSNNSNHHEAEAAMLKAQEIAIQNNIDISQVSSEEDKKENITKEEKNVGQRLPICSRFITGILAKFFGVSLVVSGNRYLGRTIHFIGKPQDVEFAKWAYEYLNEVFINSWRKYKEDNNKPLEFREIYLLGLCRGLYNKLQENKKNIESNINEENKDKYALVVLDNKAQLAVATKQFFNNLTSGKQKKVKVKDQESYNAGYNNGQKINVNRVLI